MPILKGVSSCLSPELLKVLAEMGHGDQIGTWLEYFYYRIVIADANFPAASVGSHCPAGVIRLDGIAYRNEFSQLGHDIPRILNGICKLFPLDQYVEKPVLFLNFDMLW